jgi:hypothetical protein
MKRSPHPNNERTVAAKARGAFKRAYQQTMSALGEAAVVVDGAVVIKRADGKMAVVAPVPALVRVIETPGQAAE